MPKATAAPQQTAIKKEAEIQVKPKISAPAQDTEFGKEIPYELRDDINYAIQQTGFDKKEKGLTFCRIHDKDSKYGIESKIRTSSYAKGDRGSTEVHPCEQKYGQSEKIGDFHTHPIDEVGWGITPSESDFTAGLLESKDYRIKQISCIAGDKTKMIHCFQPRQIPSEKKIKSYEKALQNTGPGDDVDPYFRNNIYKDFTHTWYNRRTFERINPSSSDIVSDALGGALHRLRDRDIKELEKGTFCDLIQDYNKPNDNSVGIECRKRMKGTSVAAREPDSQGYEAFLPGMKHLFPRSDIINYIARYE